MASRVHGPTDQSRWGAPQIPRGGNSDPKSGNSYDIKYINQQCFGIAPIIYTGNEFLNCGTVLSLPDSHLY